MVATVPLRTSETLATRLGPIPEYVLSGLALIAAAVAVTGQPAVAERSSPDGPDVVPMRTG